MDTVFQDLRHAARSLRNAPAFTSIAVVSLGLAIGATTTAFSLVSGLVFARFGFPEMDRLVDVHEHSATRLCAGCGVGTSWDGYHDWRRSARSFSALGAFTEQPFVIGGDDVPERVSGALVSADLLPMLGAAPALGRGFIAEEDRAGGAAVVLLSDALWRRRFDAEPGILGRSIRVNGRPHTVVGVMPPRFAFPERSQLWVPLEAHAARAGREHRDLGVIARLAPGVTLEQANLEMATIARALEEQHAEQREWTAAATPLRRDMVGEEGRYFLLLLGAVGFVLLIACFNLAGLLLARGANRQREMAVRVAAGASRRRLVRLLLSESLLLAAAGGLLGLVAAVWAIDAVSAASAATVPYWVRFQVDARVLAFGGGLTAVTAIGFGLVPALRASRPDLVVMLKENGAGSVGGREQQRLRSGLVVAELALTLVLLAGAGLMIRTFVRMDRAPAGYDASELLLAELVLLDARFEDGDRLTATVRDVVGRLDRMPAISAAVSHTRFLAGFGTADRRISAEDLPALAPGVSPRFAFAVTPGFPAAQGLRLLQGRDFSWTDGPGSLPVAIVNEQLARSLWPGQSPIGRRIKLGEREEPLPWLTIVGVIANTDGVARAGARLAPWVYVPFAQAPGRPAQLIVRGTTADPLALVPTVRAEVAAIDPDLPIDDVRSGRTDLARRFWHIRTLALILGSLAAFAGLLAAIGIYGLVAYSVACRTREIGIRMALGAERADVLRLVGRQGAALAALGLALGLAGSAALTRLLGSLLYGTSPLDPLVLLAVGLVLVAIAFAATIVPARRATRVDPMTALRVE
jgi:predicted permease